jgi:16S rRNA (adenine1518-N6/adenine1519-N6)-dimethyltransferase
MPQASSAGPPERVGTARLLAAHGLRPDTDLGQHFLLDENLVDLAVREGDVRPDDVVFEIGPGLGTLTAALARAARHVHAIEVDRRLEPVLAESLYGVANATIHWGDALALEWEALEPAPTRLVANLPYAIATPTIVESVWRLPTVMAWAVMVQREVADRWMAPVGSALYGAPSVLLQLATDLRLVRAVGPQVFTPRPRVDSAIVGLVRRGPVPSSAVRSLVHAAFAQRRKTLVNTLSAAGGHRSAVSAALARLDLPPAARAQELTPPLFTALAEELAWTG